MGYGHIVCVAELSGQDRAAVKRAMELADCYGARFALLHVVDHFAVDRSNEFIAPEDVDPKVYREQQARRLLDDLASELQCGTADRVILFAEGGELGEIARFAREQDVDLLVFGSASKGAAVGGLSKELDVLWVHGD